MKPTNSENDLWNTLHNGNRVPINDSGVAGAPFALRSTDIAWSSGSINKAVYNTFILENSLSGEDPVETLRFENGALDFLHLLRYTNKDMLYGYNEDARYKIPGDFMAFRGYPTPMLSDELEIYQASSSSFININGTNGPAGQYLIFTHALLLGYKVPFEIVYNITITIDGVSFPVNYDFKIDPNNFKTTHYRETVGAEEELNDWVGLPQNKIYLSYPTTGKSGNITINVTSTNIQQEPVYYSGLISEVVPESEYNPTTPPAGVPLGGRPFMGVSEEGRFDLSTTVAYLSRVEQCNDFTMDEMFPRVVYENTFFLKDGDILQVGTKLYRDNGTSLPALSNPSDAGAFFWMENTPYYGGLEYGSIFQISRYLILDANSIITYYDENRIGYMGTNCWIGAYG